MEKLQHVKETFENLTENEKINYWNEFCDNNRYYSDSIYVLNDYELETFFHSIGDFAQSVSDSDHFNYNDNYFKVGDVYNDIFTGNYFDELADPDENFYEWLLDEYEDVFLDDCEEEDENND